MPPKLEHSCTIIVPKLSVNEDSWGNKIADNESDIEVSCHFYQLDSEIVQDITQIVVYSYYRLWVSLGTNVKEKYIIKDVLDFIRQPIVDDAFRVISVVKRRKFVEAWLERLE